MKKLSILFVSVLSLGMSFTSCNKNDDETPVTPASIEGKWSYNKVSATVAGFTSPEQDYPGNSAGCNKNYIEIKTGGVAILGVYAETSCELVTSTGTWAKNGTTITFKFEGQEDLVYEVASVTDSVLTLKQSVTEGGQTFFSNSIFSRS